MRHGPGGMPARVAAAHLRSERGDVAGGRRALCADDGGADRRTGAGAHGRDFAVGKMTAICQLRARARSMLAKTFTVLTLIVSLLFATQAQAFARPAETNCAAMKCVRGCCPDIACCRKTGQHGAPDAPAPAPRQDE